MTLAGAVLLADSDSGKGSPIGLFVVLVLVVAVYFLYRSMNRHLRKVPGRFDRRQDENPADPGAGDAPQPPATGEPDQPERRQDGNGEHS